MTIINRLVAAASKRIKGLVAAALLLGASANTAMAVEAGDRSVCPGAECEIVAAAMVDVDPWGGMKVTDEKGRAWTLVSFQHGPLVDIGSEIEWSDGFSVIAARDRYDDAMSRGDRLVIRTSFDHRFHLCVSGEAVRCLYVPAE